MEIGINNPGTRLCCTYKNIQNNNPHEWGLKLKSEYIMIMYDVVDSYRKYRLQPTRINQHECYLLVEDCVQELFLIKPVCEVEAREGERKAEDCQIR